MPVTRLLVPLLTVACATEQPAKSPSHESQSYAEAVGILCEVDSRAGVDPEDVLEAEEKRSSYLVEHVKNSDGIYLLTLFRTSDPKGQAELLAEAVTETKHGACPLLETLRAVPIGTASN